MSLQHVVHVMQSLSRSVIAIGWGGWGLAGGVDGDLLCGETHPPTPHARTTSPPPPLTYSHTHSHPLTHIVTHTLSHTLSQKLGADDIVDYTTQDVVSLYKEQPFDGVVDLVGGVCVRENERE